MNGRLGDERIWTVPNAVSVARLGLVPVFLVLLARDDRVAAAIVLGVLGATDWIDGTLARRLDQVSRLGRILDPLVDRIAIVATLLGLALAFVIPWWIVATIAARELALLALVPALRRRGMMALPVHFVGKAGTFILFWGLPLVLAGSVPGPVTGVLGIIGWALVLWGLAVYLVAGAVYADQAIRLVRSGPRTASLPTRSGDR